MSLQRKALRVISQSMVNALNGEQPKPSTKRKVAVALIGTFPNVWLDIKILMPKNTTEGKLGNAFRSAAKSYENQKPVLNESMESVDEVEVAVGIEDEADGEEREEEETEAAGSQNVVRTYNKDIRYLKSCVVSSQTIPKIKELLVKTSELRRGYILDGAMDLLLNCFKTNPELVLYDFSNNWPEEAGGLLDDKEKIFRFVEYTERQYGKECQNPVINNEEVAYFQRLILLLGRTKGGAKNAINDLVRLIGETDNINLICSGQQQPMILIRNGNVLQYIISLDGSPMYLDTTNFSNFTSALDLLIKIFWLFNIKFPESLKKFYEFFSCAVYDITTTPEKTSTLLDLVTRFNRFESEEESDDACDGESDEDEPMDHEPSFVDGDAVEDSNMSETSTTATDTSSNSDSD